MRKIIIDPEFRDLIPPLSADEYAILKATKYKKGMKEASPEIVENSNGK